MDNPETVRELWNALLKSSPGPTAESFCEVCIHFEELAEEALAKLLEAGATNAQLAMVCEHSAKAREAAWLALLKVGAKSWQLARLALKVPQLSERAFEQLLAQRAEPIDLGRIVCEATGRLRQLAWKKLLEIGPRTFDLVEICVEVPELEREAWEALLNAGPSNKQLVEICAKCENLRNEAWELLKSKQSSSSLVAVYLSIPALKKKAERVLRRCQKFENADLVRLCTQAPALRELAWERLLTQEPKSSELTEVCTGCEELRERAFVELMRIGPTRDDMVSLMTYDDLRARILSLRSTGDDALANSLSTSEIISRLRSFMH